MEPDWRDRVDKFWQWLFGATQCPADDVITQHRSPDLVGYPGIYAILRHQAVYVSGPADREFGIARWRALTTNNASLHIVARLGFEPDCLQIAIRPPT